jgi:hypothetical protein
MSPVYAKQEPGPVSMISLVRRLNCNNFHVDVRGSGTSITTAAGPYLGVQL